MSGGDIKEAMIVSGATDEHLKAARILVEQARMSPEAKTKLFRGLSVDKAGTWLDTIQVGEDVTMSRLTSFSASREKAALYADKSRGSFKYELHIEGSSKSFATDKITGMGHMGLIRFRGHRPKGGYDGQNGIKAGRETSATTVL